MTIRSSSASSSATPGTSQTPTATTSNWRTNKHTRLKALEIQGVKSDILKVLSNDRQAIKTAQANVAKQHNFGLLEKSGQERRMKEASLRCVEQRIDNGRYVSCRYPEFAGFVPQAASGIIGSIDSLKADYMARQLAALQKGCSAGQLYSDDDDDDDDEEIPHCKNEKRGNMQKMSDIPAYAKRNAPMPLGPSCDLGAKENSSSQRKTTTANRRTQDGLAAFHGLKRKRADEKNDEDGNKRKMITWRAVSRGQCLLASSPASNSKQPSLKGNPWFGRVVFRGQVTTEDVKTRINSGS